MVLTGMLCRIATLCLFLYVFNNVSLAVIIIIIIIIIIITIIIIYYYYLKISN